MDKDTERLMDVTMYIACLCLSAFRFARGENPFDFESLPVAEFIISKTLPFIQDENIDYRKAHLDFIQTMVENGWSHGPENFEARTHPDITDWDSLDKTSKEMYGYFAGIVCSAREFYQSIKAEIENDLVDSFKSNVFNPASITSGTIH